jgi:hypothetical protein
MEHWKETDEWYTIVNHASKHDGKAKLRVQCCRVPNQIAAARCLAALRRARGARDQRHSTRLGSRCHMAGRSMPAWRAGMLMAVDGGRIEASVKAQGESAMPPYLPDLRQAQPSQATEAWAEGGNFGSEGLPEAGLNGLPGHASWQQQQQQQ